MQGTQRATRGSRGDWGDQQEYPIFPLTYEQYEDEADCIEVNTRVRERVAERGIDDEEKHAAAGGAERRFLSLKPVLDVSPDNLKYREQQVASFQRCRVSSWASQSDSDSRKT